MKPSEVSKRPDWVEDVERTSSGTLLVVRGRDGKLRGVRLSTRPLSGWVVGEEKQ